MRRHDAIREANAAPVDEVGAYLEDGELIGGDLDTARQQAGRGDVDVRDASGAERRAHHDRAGGDEAGEDHRNGEHGDEDVAIAFAAFLAPHRGAPASDEAAAASVAGAFGPTPLSARPQNSLLLATSLCVSSEKGTDVSAAWPGCAAPGEAF